MVSVPENGEWSERILRTLQAELGRHPGARAVGDQAAQQLGHLVSLAEVVMQAKMIDRSPPAQRCSRLQPIFSDHRFDGTRGLTTELVPPGGVGPDLRKFIRLRQRLRLRIKRSD